MHIASGALEERVIQCLRDSPPLQELLRRQRLCSATDGPTLQEEVRQLFADYRGVPPDQVERARGQAKYRRLAAILTAANMALPITLRDWKVDRVTEAEEKWGLQKNGMAGLEALLVEECEGTNDGGHRPIHLHKGPGNGELMRHLRSASGRLEEVGVGDKLYFTLQGVLEQFAVTDRRSERTVRKMVEFLSIALQKELHGRWFEDVTDKYGITRMSRLKVDHCDLNEMFALLAHPGSWLPNIYANTAKAHMSRSREFVDDDVGEVPLDVQDYLQKLPGCDMEFLTAKSNRLHQLHHDACELVKGRGNRQKLIDAFQAVTGEMPPADVEPSLLRGAIERHLTALGRSIETCRSRNEMEPHPLDAERTTLQGRLNALYGLLDAIRKRRIVGSVNIVHRLRTIVLGAPVSPEMTEEQLETVIRESLIPSLQEQCTTLKERIRRDDGPRKAARDALETRRSLHVYGKFFSPQFLRAIEQHGSYERANVRIPLDLNRSGPQMDIHNFVPGYFTDVFEAMPNESCRLISSSRGDSHETSTPLRGKDRRDIKLDDTPEQFERDVGRTVDLLEPGGIYITDGIRESFSRIHRFAEVRRAISGREDLQADIIMDGTSHEPLSLIVRRRHPEKGFLSDERLRPLLRVGATLIPLSKITALRPDQDIDTVVRRQVLSIVDGNREAFRRCRDEIPAQENRTIRRATTMRYAEQFGLLDPALLERVRGEIRIAVGKVLESTPQDERERVRREYGTALDDGAALPEDLCNAPDFFAMTAGLMETCGVPPKASREVRWLYERTLFRVIAAPVHRMLHEENNDDTSLLSPEKEESWKAEAFDAGRNVSLDDVPVLTETDINAIIVRIGEDLRGLLDNNILQKKKVSTVGPEGLETFLPDHLHAFPRLRTPSTSHNTHRALDVEKTADNAWFATPEAANLLRHKKTEVIRLLGERMKERGGSPPIRFFRFTDCDVNNLLERAIRLLLGHDDREQGRNFSHFVATTPIDLGELAKGNAAEYCKHLRRERWPSEAVDQGTLFIVGGSYHNPDKSEGQFFQDTYGQLLLEAQLAAPSRTGGFYVCFGEQNMWDLLAKHHNLPHRCKPGALEFCPVPHSCTSEGLRSLFADCPSRLTLGATHGRHAVGLEDPRAQPHIKVLAHSDITGLPMAYSALGGRILGIQSHPELFLTTSADADRLRQELNPIGQALQEAFGVDSARIMQQWTEVREHLRGEAGLHVTANALLQLLDGMECKGPSPERTVHHHGNRGGRQAPHIHRTTVPRKYRKHEKNLKYR